MKNLPARVSENSDPLVARPMPPRVEEKSIDIASVWNVIRAGKWLILSALFVTTLFAFLYSIFSEPTYEASSTVSVNTRGSFLPGAEVAINRPVVADEIGLLQRSGELAVRVSKGLVSSAEALGSSSVYPVVEENQPNGDEVVNAIAASLWRQMSYRDLGSGMISITAQSSSRHEAKELANLFASEYQSLSKERSRASIVAARQFLEQQLELRREERDSIELAYAQVARKNDLPRQGTGGELVRARYQQILESRATAERDVRRYELERGSLQNSLETARESIASGVTQDLQLRINTIDNQIAALSEKLSLAYRNNPALIDNESSVPEVAGWKDEISKLRQDRAVLNNQLLNATANSGGSGNDYANETQARIRELNILVNESQQAVNLYDGQLTTIGRTLDAVPLQMFEVEQVERQRQSAQGWYQTLQSQLQQFRIAEQAELGYVDVIKKAGVPGRPVKPDMRTNVLLAMLLGLAGGIGLAFVRTAVRQKLDTPDQVAGLGYPLLGSVPLMTKEIKANFKGKEQIEFNGTKKSTALVTLHSPWSPASEHYRLIRTNLQLGADGSMPRVMMITSPEPGDGKSVTSLNLAISIAQSGGRTLIIDADLRRATLHKLLGTSVSPGLADMLSARPTNSEVGDMEEYKTDVESLYFLPAGRTLVPPPELLGSPRMRRLIDQFKLIFDTIIIDTPPVLAVTDSLILSPCCQAAVVVVSANKTTPKAINASISALENVRIPIAGVVFNRHNTDRDKTGYYDYSNDYSYAIEDE